MLELNQVYRFTSTYGDEFIIVLCDKSETDYYTGYDENYLQYKFICDDKSRMIGRLYDMDSNEYIVIVTPVTPKFIINVHSHLCMLNADNNKYYYWQCEKLEELRKLFMDDGEHLRCKCKASDLKKVKSTGNYRVKLNVEGEGYSRYYQLLMDECGNIIHKAELFE